MTASLKKSTFNLLAAIFMLGIFLSGCSGMNLATLAGSASAAQVGRPSASYTLKASLVDGEVAFIGVGGEIDGRVNPDLTAGPGQVVRITLVNGDGVAHRIRIPGLDTESESVTEAGASTTFQAKLYQSGKYTYVDPGYSDGRMQGSLLVGIGNTSVTTIDEDTGAAEQGEANAAEAGAESVSQGSQGISGAAAAAEAVSIVREPTDLPASVGGRAAETVRFEMEAVELEGRLADGTTFTYWTFDGKVPGPFLRVRVGDTVELRLTNRADSMMTHSIDLHAVTGPGGGAAVTQVLPGEDKSFTFKALSPGLYVYHCATPMVAHHMANGMYGLILVEPEGGLPEVDREFYIMQGEIYTTGSFGAQGLQQTSVEKLLAETPDYMVFNGAVGALTAEHPLQAQVGETVRIYMGVGGPNFISSFHVIGEIFDRVYDQASLTSPPLTDVQTTLVPPGGATVVEFGLEVPGRYILVDHALSRLEHGLAGLLEVEGPDNPEVFFSEHPADGSH